MYRRIVALSTTDSIRKEEQEANRTDALFSLLSDAFHMTERKSEQQRKGRKDGVRESCFNLCYVPMS